MHCEPYVCLFVNPSFVFYPNAQHRNKLEIENLIRVELSLAFSGNIYYLKYLFYAKHSQQANQ